MDTGLLGLAVLLRLIATSSADNIALGKWTEQTGQYLDLSSDRAVDGQYGISARNQTYCAHPFTLRTDRGPVEWKVDLGGRYTITTITLYNTFDIRGAIRLRFLKVNVLDDAGLVAECGDKTTEGTAGEVWTTNCHADVTGRYVQVVRYGGIETYAMTLCEVEVTGQLYEVCGECLSPPCHPDTGVCDGGCQLWWTGDACHTEIHRIDYTDEHISASSSSDVIMSVDWDQISVPSGLENYYKYRISHSPSSGTDPQYVQQTAGVSRLSVTLDSLQPNTEYTITVTPVREMRGVQETGTPYPTQTVRTLCGNPDEAEITLVTSSDLTVFMIYTIPEPRCDRLEDVTVEYRLSSQTSWSSEQMACLQGSSFALTVTEDGTYELRLKVTNNQGLSSYSRVVSSTVSRLPATSTTKTTSATIIPCRQIECNGASSVVPWAVVGVVTGLLLASLGVNVYGWRRSKSRAEKPSSHHDYVNSDVITNPDTRADPEYELTDDVIQPRLRNNAYNDTSINAGQAGPYEDLGTRDPVPVSTYDEIH